MAKSKTQVCKQAKEALRNRNRKRNVLRGPTRPSNNEAAIPYNAT